MDFDINFHRLKKKTTQKGYVNAVHINATETYISFLCSIQNPKHMRFICLANNISYNIIVFCFLYITCKCFLRIVNFSCLCQYRLGVLHADKLYYEKLCLVCCANYIHASACNRKRSFKLPLVLHKEKKMKKKEKILLKVGWTS